MRHPTCHAFGSPIPFHPRPSGPAVPAAPRLPATVAALLAGSLLVGCQQQGSGGSVAPGTQTTGRFTDPPVEGLEYSTPTFSGVTAADGSFLYLTGEAVTFSLGSVVLGSAVPAQPRMDAFDLVPGAQEPLGAAELRRLRAQWGSNGPDADMLRTYEAINLLTFLYSFDEDKDDSNGILLQPGLGVLLSGTTIDFSQPTFRFLQRTYALRERLHRAFEQGLVVSARRIHPFQAFDRHCAALGLTPYVWLETRVEYDAGNNGIVDSVRWSNMDTRGFRIDDTLDSNANGTIDAYQAYTFDDFGAVLTSLRDNDGNSTIDRAEYHVYDVHGYQTRLEVDSDGGGAIDRITYFSYDLDGNLLKRENDFDADGIMDSVEDTTYDAAGRRIKVEYDSNANGVVDTIDSWTYDPQGNALTFEQDGNGDGFPEARTTFQYDAAGNPTREDRDFDVNGTTDMRVAHTWDAAGNMLTEEWDYTADGTLDLIVRRTYDAQRRTTRYEQDNGANGSIDDVSVYRYADSAAGLEVLQEHDYGDDGTINYRMRQRWGGQGQQVGIDWDTNGDGLYENSQSMVQSRATLMGTALGD